MLQRIYGVSYQNKAELEARLAEMEEARKRDHNKLGRELEYFTTSELIGQGLPILLPKGARVIQTLQRWVEDEEEKRGYLLTQTPLMAKRELIKFPATGIIILTACLFWAIRTTKRRNAMRCGR